MLIVFKVTVKAAGSNGPVLGDNNTTTQVTLLWPTTTINSTDALGAKTAAFNNATRQDYMVARVQFIGIKANTNPVGVGARGTKLASMFQGASSQATAPMVIGFGDRNDINLGDLDVDATTNGEGWLVIAEIR